jgi:hypothetical protein
MSQEIIELENDPENPCFGCGPNNPLGLQLHFFKKGSEVFAEKTFGKGYDCWPGQLHGGIIFGILECTLQWTFYSEIGHVGPTRKFTFDPSGQVFIGKPVKLVGRIVGHSPDSVFVRAEVVQDGTVRASIESEIVVVSSIPEFKRLRPTVEIDDVMRRNLEMP